MVERWWSSQLSQPTQAGLGHHLEPQLEPGGAGRDSCAGTAGGLRLTETEENKEPDLAQGEQAASHLPPPPPPPPESKQEANTERTFSLDLW